MHVMNGLETLPKIREKYPSLKVIILTMHTDPGIVTTMMRMGANSYLTKNIDSELIYQAIKCVFEYDYYYSEAIETAWLGSDIQFERQGHEYTYKEQQIIDFVKQNKTIKEMAEIIDISESTVTAMMARLKIKTNQ